MPRVGRELSKTGIYHVMLRGNERRNIFMDDEDRMRFIDTLYKKSKENEFLVLAYCLMDNHLHLLISEGNDLINRAMKRIGVSYVYYFNKKYKRTGHLFQDRFKSEPINNDRYLPAAVRYIHNNPVKANIVQEPAQFQWSSYNSYISNDNVRSDLIDRDFILKMFSDNEEQAIKQFIEFSRKQSDDQFIDVKEETSPEKIIKNKAEALNYIEFFLKERDQTGYGKELMKNKNIRDELIRYLKDNSALSTREIAAVLGINRGMVQRV